ncbi:MAG: threonylcarbamoyl-AMP synthase [Lachnospiraceae bacterium]|nr:threonylcarbamoyl-AMP synthase [Lachnospiraceae bacterium]
MDTIIKKYDETHRDPEVIEQAAAILQAGGLVAFPTETVYGLGGDALNPHASARIYAAKGRPSDNPLIVHIADMEALEVLTAGVPEKGKLLAQAFWPGPMTMIFNKSAAVPLETTGGLDTVAVRMPSHFTARELIRGSGVYIAAPSANLSGRPSPTCAEHCIQDLSGRVDMIIDGGRVQIGLESTIIDLTCEVPVILRPGYITREMIEAVIGEVELDRTLFMERPDPDLRPKAPGMKYRHYAPKGEMAIVEGSREAVAEKINSLTYAHEERGEKCAVISAEEDLSLYRARNVFNIGGGHDEEAVAANLYATLREMDDLGIEYIYSESFAGSGLRAAIMNRLIKAAGHRIIQA